MLGKSSCFHFGTVASTEDICPVSAEDICPVSTADIWRSVVAVVVAAADETSHAEARLAKPSQASQSREGLTNGIGYFCDQAPGVLDHKATNIS